MRVTPKAEPNPWTCDVCRCNFNSGNISTKIKDSKVCGACIRHIFERAIVSEANYPPLWAGEFLNRRDSRHVLDAKLISRFDCKVKEWNCAPKDRVYCRQIDPPKRTEACNTFLGGRTGGKHCRQCQKCMWYTCLRCLECFSTSDSEGRDAEIAHHCDPSVEEELRRRAFEGLKRGRDFQDCPNPVCQHRVELSDGCNCMTCVSCGTQFCYICGQGAIEGSDHWNYGSSCPKWNQPGARNAQWTDDGDDADGQAVPDDVEDDDMELQLEMLRLVEHRDTLHERMTHRRQPVGSATRSPLVDVSLPRRETTPSTERHRGLNMQQARRPVSGAQDAHIARRGSLSRDLER